MGLHINGWDACYAQRILASRFGCGSSRPCCVEIFLCKQAIFGKHFIFRVFRVHHALSMVVREAYCVTKALHFTKVPGSVTCPLQAPHGLKTWSVVCLVQYWKFANYVSTLP